MAELAIHTEGLTREFALAGGGEPLRAVDGLSIDVSPGTVFGFLGPNGAGKTTTIRLLLGLLEPTSGRATVLGYDAREESDEIRARVGALLEHPGLYERLTVEDNLDLYGRIWRMTATDRRRRVKELLEGMDLWERRGEVLGDWSRGMKQKVAVARAMLNRPRLIFFDEPTAGLDPVAAAALRDDLAALAAREGVTVFLTTHNLAEAEKLCGLVAVISHGKLVAIGHPEELMARGGRPRAKIIGRGFCEEILAAIRARPEVRSAGLVDTAPGPGQLPPGAGPEVAARAAGAGDAADVVAALGTVLVELDGSASVAGLVEMLVSSGVRIEEVRKGKASLEEAFLSLVGEGEADGVRREDRSP